MTNLRCSDSKGTIAMPVASKASTRHATGRTGPYCFCTRLKKKKAPALLQGPIDSGGTCGGRTHDKRIKSPLLYQLSYGPYENLQLSYTIPRSLKL